MNYTVEGAKLVGIEIRLLLDSHKDEGRSRK